MASRDDQLRDVLGNNVHRNSFLDFCKREHCAENLQFYNAICEFEAADNDDDRAAMAKEMIRTFVKPGGSEVVNMTDETRVALTAAVSDGAITVDMFAEQKAAAFKDMSGDTLPRFMKSDLYEEATKASAAGESKLVAASHAHEDTVLRMRKKKFLGLKLKQRHTKADLRSFEQLGSAIRSTAAKSGFLVKRGDNHQTWKRRWCVLCHYGLAYFLDEYRYAPKGVVLAHEMLEVVEDMDEELDSKFTFGVRTKKRTYVIQAANSRDRKRWVAALAEAIKHPTMVPAGNSGGS